MRTIGLLLLVAVGCGDVTAEMMDGGGAGNSGAAGASGAAGTGGGAMGGAGGAPSRVCDAALETLTGTATYVMGSLAASEPAAPVPGQTGITCEMWARDSGFERSVATEITVTAGAVSGDQLAKVSSGEAGGVCVYKLRRSVPASTPTVRPCAVTLDYVLLVP